MIAEEPYKEIAKKQWFLATTKSKDEKRALQNLTNQGIQAFIPTCVVEKIKRGKKIEEEEPLFPGYIFICLEKNDLGHSKVRSTRGVRDWVRFSGQPAKVSHELIHDLQQNQLGQTKTSNLPSKGQPVLIKSGPFSQLSAIYQMSDGLERSVVLLDILGKQQKITIENSDIEKL